MAFVWIQSPTRPGDDGKRYVTEEKAALLELSGWTTTTPPTGAPSPVPGDTPVTHDELAAALAGLGAGGVADATSSTKGVARIMAGTADDPRYPASRIEGQVQDVQISSAIARAAAVSALAATVDELPFPEGSVNQTGAAAGKVPAVTGTSPTAYGLRSLAELGIPWSAVTAKPSIPATYNDLSGTVPQSALPAIALTEHLGAVASQAAMLALVGQRGDWCTRTDRGTDWQLIAEPSTSAASWREMTYPASPVASVNGRTGSVSGLAEANAVVARTLFDAKGDLLAATADDTPARVAVGNNGQVLTSDSTAPAGMSWQPPSASGMNPVAAAIIFGG